MARTSPAGIEQLIADEGEVLRAYRDIVGVLTIGVGLTAASGVVKPTVGMVITKAESRRLLSLALSRNYEPAVSSAMPGAKQHEFDGGVSFHFNTGAIARASWVKNWLARRPASEIRAGLMAWNKAGGKVVRGLTLRRQREADLILEGRYSHGITSGPGNPALDEPTGPLRRGARGETAEPLVSFRDSPVKLRQMFATTLGALLAAVDDTGEDGFQPLGLKQPIPDVMGDKIVQLVHWERAALAAGVALPRLGRAGVIAVCRSRAALKKRRSLR